MKVLLTLRFDLWGDDEWTFLGYWQQPAHEWMNTAQQSLPLDLTPVVINRKTVVRKEVQFLGSQELLLWGNSHKKEKAEIPREHGQKSNVKHYKTLKETSSSLAQPLKVCRHLQSLSFWQEDNLQRYFKQPQRQLSWILVPPRLKETTFLKCKNTQRQHSMLLNFCYKTQRMFHISILNLTRWNTIIRIRWFNLFKWRLCLFMESMYFVLVRKHNVPGIDCLQQNGPLLCTMPSYMVRQEDNKLTQENPRLKARIPFKWSVSLTSYWVYIVHMREKKEKMFVFSVLWFTVKHNAMGSVSCQQF